MRVVTTRNQQVARVDHEDDAEVSGAVRDAVIAGIERAGASADALVLSDYRKGVVTPEVIRAAARVAAARRVPLLVDPKVPHADRYRGATIITPNHHEAELMTQIAIRTPDDARRAARRLHEQTGASVLITWGEHGMWVCDASARRRRRGAARAGARGRRRHRRRRHGHRDAGARAWRRARGSPTRRGSPTWRPASSSRDSVPRQSRARKWPRRWHRCRTRESVAAEHRLEPRGMRLADCPA